jgi:hypothetical protein
MGIPAAFRWLSKKYPKIISPVIEDQPKKLDDGSEIPVDTTQPNPNGEEFDNLYLDMNGIVHPCSHPEDRPAPKDEEEMMLEIFRYTDRVVNMVRPRKILMIAVGMSLSFWLEDGGGRVAVICLDTHALTCHSEANPALSYRWRSPSRKDEPAEIASLSLSPGSPGKGGGQAGAYKDG